MFTLLSGFYEELTFVPERRVLLLGLGAAGKTALLECMKLRFPAKGRPRAVPFASATASYSSSASSSSSSSFAAGLASADPPEKIRGLTPAKLASLAPTVGLNVARLPTGNEKLLVWDLGGAEPLRPIWKRYIAEAEALIWVVDAADPDKLDESSKCLRDVLNNQNLARAPLLVFANKQDQPGAIDPVRTSLALDLLSDAEIRPQCVQPCSAITGVGVSEGIEWLVQWLRNPAGDLKTSIKGS